MRQRTSQRFPVLLGLLAVLPLGAATAAELPVVRTEQGDVRGLVRDGMVVYHNLPFASPPVGPLRWRPPQAPQPWSGVRDATQFGHACAQEKVADFERFPKGMSEDCLYLNVFKPAQKRPSTALPVMLWIHGGSFRWGSAMDPAFDGRALTAEGVILVTINDRLDRFGRFSHPSLREQHADEPQGNYALMDQLAALQWVQRNIGRFGGDPRRITIFGCSAGGVSVDFLMSAPQSRGLFAGAIAQSGSIVPEGERRLSEKVGQTVSLDEDGRRFAAHFDIAEGADTAVRLRALTAEQVISYPQKDFSMQPIVDGKVIVDDPARVFARGEQMRVPFMSGASTYEASLIKPFNLPLPLVLNGMPLDRARLAYGNIDDPALKDEYFKDSLFMSSAYFLTREMRKVNQRGYLYEYRYVNEAQRGKASGAYHCSETPRIFGTTWRGEVASLEDRRMGDTLRRLWVNFAKSGQPSAPGVPVWAPNEPQAPQMMQVQASPALIENPYAARMGLHMERHVR